MSTLTATPASTQTGKPVQLKYQGSVGGSLRITRPDGSKYYLPTYQGDGSKTYTPTKTGSYKAELFTKRSPLRVIAAAGIVVIANPATPPPPLNAIKVAREGGTFTLPRDGTVWYGVATGYTTRQFAAGTFPCTNGTFSTPALPSGDPLPNKVKACYAVIPAPVLTAVAGLRLVDLAWQA